MGRAKVRVPDDRDDIRRLNLPDLILAAVKAQCGGDWDRVTVEGGALTVHNNPQRLPAIRLKPVTKKEPVTKRTPTSAPAAPPPKLTFTHLPPAGGTAKKLREIAAAPPPPPAQPAPDRGPEFIILSGVGLNEAPWERLDADSTAYQLSQSLKGGLPSQCRVRVHHNVLSLAGVDLPAAEAVMWKPERVEIAEETKKKGYPVLRFWRGDVCTVLGFRTPNQPSIIAVYYSTAAYDQARNFDPEAGGGGGGAKKAEGVPKTPTQLMSRLGQLGATITEAADGKTADIAFRDQDLGKLDIDPIRADKDSCGRQFQRYQRKIYSIRQRLAKVS